jgi:hypothetical protein
LSLSITLRYHRRLMLGVRAHRTHPARTSAHPTRRPGQSRNGGGQA